MGRWSRLAQRCASSPPSLGGVPYLRFESGVMRKLLVLAFLLLSSPLWAAPTAFFDGALQAELPPLLRVLDDAAIDQMFATANSRPGAVLATPDSETRVSLNYTQAVLDAASLEATKNSLKSRIDGQEGVTWLRDEMLELNGHSWFRLDYQLASEPKREIVLGTSANNRLLFLVIATPADDPELIEGELQALIDSLEVSP